MKTAIVYLYFIGYFTYWLRFVLDYIDRYKGYYKYQSVFYKEIFNRIIQGFFISWFWFMHIIKEIMAL